MVNMRKFIETQSFDETTFDLLIKLVEKQEDGTIIPIFVDRQLPVNSPYTALQRATISRVNTTLVSKGIKEMTDEEADYLLDPHKLKEYNEFAKNNNSDEDMQTLAGFSVNKEVRYTKK